MTGQVPSGLQPLVQRIIVTLRALWCAAIATVIGLAGLGVLAGDVVQPAPAASRLPAAALALAGWVLAIAPLAIDRAILSPARIARRVAIPDPALALRYLSAAHLALWSLAGVPAVLGFAQLFLDGTPGAHLLLCAASLVVLAALMPTRSRIATRLAAALR